jgi:Transcriptional regulator/sugar kinase
MLNNGAGSNILTVRENNLSLIIRLMHRAKICTRAQLAEATGLKQATITYIIGDMIDWGIVAETGVVEGKLNRRSVGIKLKNDYYRILGIRLSRRFIELGLFDIAGNSLMIEEVAVTERLTPANAINIIRKESDKILATQPDIKLLGVGAAIPGPLNILNGQIEMISDMPGWEKVNFSEELKRVFDAPVFVDQDANCGALGEFWYGDVEGHKDILYVAAGHGIGAGIIIDGKIYRGALGTSGEIGHMSVDYGGEVCACGNRGCLELYCSTQKLRRDYKREVLCGAKGEIDIDADSIIRAAAEGDETAVKVYKPLAVFLGLGLVNIVNILNPSLIILSDRMSSAGKLLLDTVSDTLKKNLLPSIYENLTIRLGSEVKNIFLHGADALVMENILLSPTAYFKK